MTGNGQCEWSSGRGGEPRCEDAGTTRVRFGAARQFHGWFCDEHASRLVVYSAGRIVGDLQPFDPDEAERHLDRSTARDAAYTELLLRRAVARVRQLEATLLERSVPVTAEEDWTEVEPGLAARACDRAHGSVNAARVGHTSGFCLACAELYVALGAVLPGRSAVRRAVVVADARHPRDVERLTDAVVAVLEGPT